MMHSNFKLLDQILNINLLKDVSLLIQHQSFTFLNFCFPKTVRFKCVCYLILYNSTIHW